METQLQSLGNWIEDDNLHHLPTPPGWALKKFYDFDHMLVIIPSRNRPVLGEQPQYLLARRAMQSAGLGREALFENQHPDTNMLWRHGLVPIAPLRWKSGDQTWRERDVDLLLAELKRRDTWAQADAAGGLDAFVDQIEATERANEQKQRQDIREMFYHMGRDAWRSLKARTGQRNKRASDYHGVARPAQH
jgi:hypothetical protein